MFALQRQDLNAKTCNAKTCNAKTCNAKTCNAMTKGSSRSKFPRPQVIRTLPALAQLLARWRARHDRIALVPTMGALHAGHLALVRRAQRRADRVIVSIFVNPAQFAPHEDLKTYPRTFAADVAALAGLSADLVWAPSAETMYPAGFATRIVPAGAATAGLEDASRPHFFAGVATVVAKLLIQCGPDIAMFGEKDYQQLKVVTQLARDLDLKTRIVGVPTVRERRRARFVFAQCLPLARSNGPRRRCFIACLRIAQRRSPQAIRPARS